MGAGRLCSWASNTSSMTCFTPHKQPLHTGTLYAHIPAHVNTERDDTGASAQERKALKCRSQAVRGDLAVIT